MVSYAPVAPTENAEAVDMEVVVQVEDVPTAAVVPEGCIVVKVKSPDDKTHDVVIGKDESGEQLKERLAQLCGVPAERQRLIFLGKMVVDDKSLEEQGVKDGTFVHLVPKPAAACRTTSAPGEAQEPSRSAGTLSDLFTNVDLPISSVTLDNSSSQRFSFEDEYELSIWRYRVRMMSMVMFFYYFLLLMTSVSNWMEPQEYREKEKTNYARSGQFVQVQSDFLLSLVDTCENLMGLAAATLGLKTAVSYCPQLSRRFFREMTFLSVVHFFNLALWMNALYSGEIIQIPIRNRHHNHSDPTSGYQEMSEEERLENARALISAMLLVHPMLWMTMLSVAKRHDDGVRARHEATTPPAPSESVSAAAASV